MGFRCALQYMWANREEELMTMANVGGGSSRQSKHSNVLQQIFNLRRLIDQFQGLLDQIQGAETPPDKVAHPEGPETMHLQEFLVNAPDRLSAEIGRLERILGELKDSLF